MTEPLESTEVLEGQSAKLVCKVSGKPTPEIEWLKNGVRVRESRRIKSKLNGNECTLRITETRLDDDGVYKCVIRNDLGTDSSSAKLDILPLKKPEFKTKLKNVEIFEGQDARFDVQVIGTPEPEVAWYKGLNVLEPDDKIETLEEDGGRYSLTIKSASLDDAGMYKCVASNDEGKVTVRADLSVKEAEVSLRRAISLSKVISLWTM